MVKALSLADSVFGRLLRVHCVRSATSGWIFEALRAGRYPASSATALNRITIPANATNVTVGSDGTVSATLPGQTNASQVGVLQLATFANPGGLNSVGNNIYLATTASGDAVVGTPGGSDGLGTIQQGMLEQANVNIVDEFVNMILAQRSYESNSRVVKAADEMLQGLNQVAQ